MKNTLAQIGEQQAYTKPYPALVSSNMGNLTLKITMSIEDFTKRSQVYNRETIEKFGLPEDSEAQRNEKKTHTKNLAKYALAGLMHKTVTDKKLKGERVAVQVPSIQKELQIRSFTAIQPIVTNLRDVKADGSDLSFDQPLLHSQDNKDGLKQRDFIFVKFLLSQKLSVVDGQHRRKAFELILHWLNEIDQTGKYPTADSFFTPETGFTHSNMILPDIRAFWSDVLNSAMTSAFVSIECHLGLAAEQEKQLFADLNSNGLNVQKAQSQDFDQGDPVNKLVHTLIDTKKLKFPILKTDESDWLQDAGGQLRKDIHTVTCFSVLGKGSSKGSSQSTIDKTKGLAEKLWTAVQKSPNFGKAGAKSKTVLAQPVVLKALAKLAHELGLGKKTVRDESSLKKLWEATENGSLDYSHSNKIWGSLMLTPDERKKQYPGLEKYVFVTPGTNLDAGTVDPNSGLVRYGAKHNDIYRRIGDLIRFQLGFKPRPEVTRAIEKS